MLQLDLMGSLIILGLQSLLEYADGCLEFKNFFECIEVCNSILKTKTGSSSLIIRTKITKGKARFYSYKRKLQYILVNANIRVTKEGRVVLDECFNGMQESIALLGNGLDHNALDEQGSKLLDWAMIDCLSTVNQLNKCRRCLLCRQKRELKRSHVIPRFIVNTMQERASDEDLVFGLDKHLLKSAGACHYHMLCGRCEELLSQNGESDFKTKFPSSGEIAYSPWLFSFCAGVLIRCMSIVMQFPMHFNDEEMYKVLLHCRKHLLQLPVVINGKTAFLSDQEIKQLEGLTQQLKGDLDIYLFMSPLSSQQSFGVFQAPYPISAFILSRNKQLDSKSLIYNGQAHFFCLCCSPVTLIVQFDESLSSLKNRGFHITSNPTDSDRNYSIPSEEDRVKLLPVGIWRLMEQLRQGTVEDFNKVSRFIGPTAKLPTSQPVQTISSVTIPLETGSKVMFQISYLPKGFEIGKPHVTLPRNQCVTLPEGNQVIIHSGKRVPMQNSVLTILLCSNEDKFTSDSKRLYLIFMQQDDTNHIMYVDGARAEIKNSKLILTEFLLQNQIADARRLSLSQLQSLLNVALPNRHFDNINVLMHLVKSRRYVAMNQY